MVFFLEANPSPGSRAAWVFYFEFIKGYVLRPLKSAFRPVDNHLQKMRYIGNTLAFNQNVIKKTK